MSPRLTIAFAVALCSCAESAAPPLEVRFAGCRAVVAGGTCEIEGETRLSLFVEGRRAGQLVVDVDGEAVVPEALALGGGVRLDVDIVASAPGLLTIVAEDGERWTLALARATPRLELSDAGRAALREGRLDEAEHLLRKGMALHAAAGRWSDQMSDGLVLSWLLTEQRRDLSAARDVLATLASSDAARRWDAGAPRLDYYGALVSLHAGALRQALRALERAIAGAEQLGLQQLGYNAREVRAEVLQLQGLTGQALAALDALASQLGPGASPCSRGRALLNAGWLRIVAREQGDPVGEAATHARRALEVLRECPDMPGQLANAWLNLALAELQGGRTEAAAEALARSEAVADLGYLEGWRLEALGRLALAEHRPSDALAHYRALETRWSHELGAAWRAALGQARAHLALGQGAQALSQLRAAEAVLDRALAEVPLGAGRATFLGGRSQSALLLVDTLARMERPSEALDTLRHARRRVLLASVSAERLEALSTDARARWERLVAEYRDARQEAEARRREATTVPVSERPLHTQRLLAAERRAAIAVDAALAELGGPAPDVPLRPPDEGELFLGWAPSPRGGLWALSRSAEAARGVHLEGDRVQSVADAFEVEIAASAHVRLLPWGDAAPALSRPSSIGADLPRHPAVAVERALVVADPTSDLSDARREGATVAERLQARGLALTTLQGEAAERAALTRHLSERPELAHYAGHGLFDRDGEGARSRLVLAARSTLEIADILALPAVPRVIVLSGCETGRASRRAKVADLTVASAFLAAGADAVVATTRPIRDASALAFAEGFFAEPPADTSPRAVSRAFQRGLAALRARAPSHGSDWTALRLLTR